MTKVVTKLGNMVAVAERVFYKWNDLKNNRTSINITANNLSKLKIFFQLSLPNYQRTGHLVFRAFPQSPYLHYMWVLGSVANTLLHAHVAHAVPEQTLCQSFGGFPKEN